MVGGKVECNICGFKANELADDGWHQGSICPGCGSSIRQRLLWQMLTEHPVFNHRQILAGKKTLHFAPEKVLRQHIKKATGQYVSADFFAEGYDYPDIDLNLDIASMPAIESDSVDCLIACDVLEHVPDDRQALHEIYRVLRPGGYCLLTVPQRDGAATTEADLSPMSPQERERRFGQFDHLRIYGDDFTQLMRQSGFTVSEVNEKSFSEGIVKRFVLFPPVLSSRPLATNHRKIFVGRKP